MNNDTNNRLFELTAKIQEAIFQTPDIALGVGGWQLRHGKRGPAMTTNQRPDGSVTRRKDKMTLYFKPEGYLYLSYNGSSFKSGAIWTILKERYHEGNFIRLVRMLCDDYHIFFDLDEQGATKRPYKEMNQTTTTKIIPIGDEKDVACIPEAIVSRHLNLARKDQLRTFLNDVLDPLVLEGVWNDYKVGVARDGRPVFFYFDRSGRCRNGKVMRYTHDGHRDRETDGSILAIPSLLQKSGHIPAEAKFDSILFGEHLLTRYPNSPIALVESEKTALVATAVNPEIIWLATGGINTNNERCIALLSSRRVTAFPDADGTTKWSEKFGSLSGWIVSDICSRVSQERGPAWSKCDLADIIIDQCVKARK